MTPARVELMIDELVLHGVPAGDRHAVADALQAELTRLIGADGVPVAWQAPGEIEVRPATVPAAHGAGLGRAAAAAIHGGATS